MASPNHTVGTVYIQKREVVLICGTARIKYLDTSRPVCYIQALERDSLDVAWV